MYCNIIPLQQNCLHSTHSISHARKDLPDAALTEVILTGGLPPRIDSPSGADEAYRRLYPRVIAQNHKFYKRFPGDVARVQRIVLHLSQQPDGGLRLANGDHLTPRSGAIALAGLAHHRKFNNAAVYYTTLEQVCCNTLCCLHPTQHPSHAAAL